MSDKNNFNGSNIRKVIVTAGIVLLLLVAVFFYLSAAGGQDSVPYDTLGDSEVTSSAQSSDFSESSSREDQAATSTFAASQSTQSELSEPQSEASQSTQSELSEPQSEASQPTQSEPSEPQSEASQSTQSELSEPQSEASQSTQSEPQTAALTFRNKNLLDQHYEKHGKDMGFSSAEEYEKAAAAVPANPAALHKIEKEDGDDVYYIEATNEFVIVSSDGYIRTYFLPDSGKKYFDKQ